jgi:hypothetical protein
LSAGAIASIVIGCVLVLLIIIWGIRCRPQPRDAKDWNRDPNRADPVKVETSGDVEQVLDVRALVKEWSRGRGCR